MQILYPSQISNYQPLTSNIEVVMGALRYPLIPNLSSVFLYNNLSNYPVYRMIGEKNLHECLLCKNLANLDVLFGTSTLFIMT